ncbi:MAG: SRPBCC family protein [Halobaculum sp.]
MDEIVTTVDIDAPPQAVWEVLTDFESFAQWNPTMEVSGAAVEGERLDVVLTLPDRKPQAFRPEVLVAVEPRELRWRGQLFAPGLYDGEHRFQLGPLDGGERTRLTHAETFRGVLVGFVNRRIGDAVEAGFEAMNDALKRRVEGTDEPEIRVNE